MGASRALALQRRRLQQLVVLTLLLLLSVSARVVVVGAQDVQGDITALLAIKAVLVDPQSALTNWTTSTPNAPCDWRGVWCINGRVSELRLQAAGLQGPLAGRSPSQFPKCSFSLSLLIPRKKFGSCFCFCSSLVSSSLVDVNAYYLL